MLTRATWWNLHYVIFVITSAHVAPLILYVFNNLYIALKFIFLAWQVKFGVTRLDGQIGVDSLVIHCSQSFFVICVWWCVTWLKQLLPCSCHFWPYALCLCLQLAPGQIDTRLERSCCWSCDCHSIRIIDRFLTKYGEAAAAAAVAVGPGCWKYRLLIGPGTISCQDGWTRHQWSEESKYARYCDSSGHRFLLFSMIASHAEQIAPCEWALNRLTPGDCEHYMGFPKNPFRNDNYFMWTMLQNTFWRFRIVGKSDWC